MSLTGIAVQLSDIVLHDDVSLVKDGRTFGNAVLLESLGIRSMISLPIMSSANSGLVSMVVNICFDKDKAREFPLTKEDLLRVGDTLAFCLDYVRLKQDEEVPVWVQQAAMAAGDLVGLLDAIYEHLKSITRCGEICFYTWSGAAELLKPVRPSGTVQPAPGADLAFAGEELVRRCVDEQRPLMLGQCLRMDIGSETALVGATRMVVPITSSSGEVLGVLECRSPDSTERFAPSFSTFDLHALETFSRALTPAIERFTRNSQELGLLRAVEALTESAQVRSDLGSLLKSSIDVLCKTMQAEIGSIYLASPDGKILTMRAATGPGEVLVGRASYKLGEGITGSVALHGEVLRFRTRDELKGHPSFRGKYDNAIWSGPGKLNNFIGAPIHLGSAVLGVLKLSNRVPTETHPEPFFTDEDEVLIEIFCAFLAYAIAEERTIRNFQSLAQASVDGLTAANQDDAIQIFMAALEQAGFERCMLTLFDQRTRSIQGTLGSSSWSKLADHVHEPLDGKSVLSTVLLHNDARLVHRSEELWHGDKRFFDDVVSMVFVVPLRVEDELIGTLQVGLAPGRGLDDLQKLIVRAFGSHLSISLSTLRNRQNLFEMAASTRFLVAEAMSGMVIHSLHKKLAEIVNALDRDLKRPEVRQRQILLESLTSWRGRLTQFEVDMKNVLNVVRAPEEQLTIINVDAQVQPAFHQWYSFLISNKCQVDFRLGCKNPMAEMARHAFAEVLAVLLVNAVQAHAKLITVETRNEERHVSGTGEIFDNVVCIDVADDGGGLATDNPEEIFSATYTTKPMKFGTGLGLYFARRLVREVDGELYVVPIRKGQKGAVFRIILRSVGGLVDG